jgi:hypothetical protein
MRMRLPHQRSGVAVVHRMCSHLLLSISQMKLVSKQSSYALSCHFRDANSNILCIFSIPAVGVDLRHARNHLINGYAVCHHSVRTCC